ncbi:hypothetical protein BFL43_26095 [Williamsia sp. 1135]|nr:hypothetical protein BFL43_26095 [Williamsia sp. 1135]
MPSSGMPGSAGSESSADWTHAPPPLSRQSAAEPPSWQPATNSLPSRRQSAPHAAPCPSAWPESVSPPSSPA